jgi:long-subunit fatty acid transport protein
VKAKIYLTKGVAIGLFIVVYCQAYAVDLHYKEKHAYSTESFDDVFESVKTSDMAIGLHEAVIDNGPNVAYRFYNGFLIDAGVDTLNGNLVVPGIGAGHSSDTDGYSSSLADNWSGDYHVGASFEISERAQFGVHCRSKTNNSDKNIYRVAVGGSYQYNDRWQFKLGTLLDKVPTQEMIRNMNLLDHEQASIALGLQYWLSQTLALDMGYSYVFYKKPTYMNPATTLSATGNLQNFQQLRKNQMNRFGLRLTWELL